MADPITWRNVYAPSFGGVSQGINSGANLLTSGIRGLAAQSANVGNEAVAREDQVQSDLMDSFRAKLVGAKTGEDVDNVLASVGGSGLSDANIASTLASGQGKQRDIYNYDRTLADHQRADLNQVRADELYQEGQVNKQQALFADDLISNFQGDTEKNVQNAIGTFAKDNGLTMENGDIVGPLTPEQQAGMAKVLAPIKQANMLEGFRNQLKGAGLDSTEIQGHLKTFENAMNTRDALPQAAQRALDGQIDQANNQVDILHNQAKDDHQKLVREQPYSEEELLRQKSVDEASVRNLILEKAPDGSFLLDIGSGRKGGSDLQKSVTATMGEQFIIVPASSKTTTKTKSGGRSGKGEPRTSTATEFTPETIRKATAAEINNPEITKHKPEWWMVESAILASAQSSEEAIGDPTVDVEAMNQHIMNLATNVQEKQARNRIDQSRARLQELDVSVAGEKLKNAGKLTEQAREQADVGGNRFTAIMNQFSR